jgi:hypothetical protein
MPRLIDFDKAEAAIARLERRADSGPGLDFNRGIWRALGVLSCQRMIETPDALCPSRLEHLSRLDVDYRRVAEAIHLADPGAKRGSGSDRLISSVERLAARVQAAEARIASLEEDLRRRACEDGLVEGALHP